MALLINNINVTPTFFTRLHEEALCPICNSISRRGMQQESNAILCLNPPQQVHHLDVLALVQAELSAQVMGIVCASRNTLCNGGQLLGHIVDQVGENSIVWLC